MKGVEMSDKDQDVNLFAVVSYGTHRKLAMLAAKYRVGKLEMYRQAITWAANHRDFEKAIKAVYSLRVKSE